MGGIDLIYQGGFSWYSSGPSHVKGFAFVSGNRHLSGAGLLEYFGSSRDFGGFIARLSGANGMFSVVLDKGDRIWLGVDRMRTFPLFFTGPPGNPDPAEFKAGSHTPARNAAGNRPLISDSTDRIVERNGDWSINRDASVEFLATGYVTGCETLAEGIFQVQAGEAVEMRSTCEGKSAGPALNRVFYSSYRTPGTKREPVDKLSEDLEDIAGRIAGRLAGSLDGRSAILALSGGYDSRFVAAMLKKLDYPRVTCFSYGREGNRDMERAEEVAGRLGYGFIPIPYSESMISGFVNDGDFNDYVRFTANRASMFFMQEYFAVKHLKENGMVPGDAVFIPGHSGDFFGGSQLIKHGLHGGNEDFHKTVRRIFDIKYALCRPQGLETKTMQARIAASLGEKRASEEELPYSMHEDWDLKEKLAKFIVNSCNVYAWFGYEYRLPLYDYELQEFFRDLPFALKANKQLYDEFLRTRVFGGLNLNFPDELQPDLRTQRRARLKRRIRNMLPSSMVPVTVSRKDPIFYHEITRILVEDLAQRGIRIKIRGNSYNSLIVQWYIARLKSGLQIP